MKFLKSFLMGTGGVALAALVLSLLAPKAVHAVAATAVQVVNTSASPAITQDTSLQASQIVTITCQPKLLYAYCSQVLPTGYYGGQPGPDGGYMVPANQYFVLKSMDLGYGTSGMFIKLFNNDPTNGASEIAEYVSLAPNSQTSFGPGIVFGPGVEVYPQPSALVTDVLTLHGYLTSN